ncbi:biosynthetic-type acetolactate synthase large subunit [Buchnera aphidicola]|uniref:biosynthetic-type acetolactate synthase large subunit n=1 Tax=Buchnera aphidicola TaxID=9 RepID=UPI00094D83B4|nr:biosynthetic-type acetolactate synthase large subunit [Buchnera aphidicola]
MTLLSGAEMVIQSLIDLKIEVIFGYPGGAVLDIYDAIHTIGHKKIQHILVRHEQAATHMADGYARCTGKTGAVLVTSGPGATNAITGIATAYMDSIPLIIISGQVSSELIGFDAFQECDMIGISRPIVKHSFLVKKSEDIPLIFQKSYFLASRGRPGPVVIDLPKNILDQKIKKEYIWPKYKHIQYYQFIETKKNIKNIKKALKTLLKAKKPIIYAGGGVISANCHSELYNLATIFNIPVTMSLMALGSFPGNNPQNLSMLGMHGTYEANMAMHHSDVILAIGVRFDDRTTNNVEKYCPNATIIHIDIDPTSISKTITADIPVIGDAKKILKKILKIYHTNKTYYSIPNLERWWKKIKNWKNITTFHYSNSQKIIKPQHLIKIIHKMTKGDAYIASDVGQHQMFTALHYTFNKPRRWINSGGLGTMGFGLPAALGVKIAFPQEFVICITGDGSIQMNIQELSTAKQYGLAILIINLNNKSLGMVKQWQDIIYSGRHSHSYMKSLPNFMALAESYGHIGMQIKQSDEIIKKLKKAIKKVRSGSLVFVDVDVDPQEHVYPMQIKNGGMNDMLLKK